MHTDLKNGRPRVAGTIYFHCNRDRVYWRLDYPAMASLTAYQRMMHDGQFQAGLGLA
jgi:hypothetical protein